MLRPRTPLAEAGGCAPENRERYGEHSTGNYGSNGMHEQERGEKHTDDEKGERGSFSIHPNRPSDAVRLTGSGPAASEEPKATNESAAPAC